MPLPRNHSLISAYAILFTIASGILGYDLCTHEPRKLPDLPVATMRVVSTAPTTPAPIAALERGKPVSAPAAETASLAGSQDVLAR